MASSFISLPFTWKIQFLVNFVVFIIPWRGKWVGVSTRMLLSSSSSFVKLLFYSFESTTLKGLRRLNFSSCSRSCFHCPKAKFSIQIAKGLKSHSCKQMTTKRAAFKPVKKGKIFVTVAVTIKKMWSQPHCWPHLNAHFQNSFSRKIVVKYFSFWTVIFGFNFHDNYSRSVILIFFFPHGIFLCTIFYGILFFIVMVKKLLFVSKDFP